MIVVNNDKPIITILFVLLELSLFTTIPVEAPIEKVFIQVLDPTGV